MISTINIKYALLPILLLMTSVAHADSCSPGDAFRHQAGEYMAKAYILQHKGLDEAAQMYLRMAKMKKYAAALVDNGRWPVLDWESFYTDTNRIRNGGDVEKLITELTPLPNLFDKAVAAK